MSYATIYFNFIWLEILLVLMDLCVCYSPEAITVSLQRHTVMYYFKKLSLLKRQKTSVNDA